MRFRLPRRRGVLLLAAALGALVVPATMVGASADHSPIGTSGAVPSASGIVNESPRAWLVELKGSAAEFRADAKKVGLTYNERFAYSRLFKGVSVSVPSGQLGKLRGLSSVAALHPVNTYTLGPGGSFSPDLATAIQMTGADIAQNELGLSGDGVKVAVMDSGIDVDHPAFGGDGNAAAPHSFPGPRIVAGTDFVGDTFEPNPQGSVPFQPVPQPDPLPDDCNGHGTHVAGIVGADGEVTGVAPDVTFGAYKVFGCDGSTTDDVMIAAMELALADGMHVLNMSIGDAFNNWPGSPTAAAASALVDAGMVVVASIGNSGTSGLYAAGAPGVGNKVIGVASYDNVQINMRIFRVTPDGLGIGYMQADASPLAPTSGTASLARTGTQTTTNDACAALPAGSLNDKVALVRRGTCTFYVKARNAMEAGADAVVIYNNAPGHQGGITVDPTLGGVPGGPPITIPVVNISGAQGNIIDTRLASGPVTMTWTNEFARFPNATGNLLSSFTSYGVAADLTLKPDIGAPGGFIFSAIPLEQGGVGNNSGTSMSSPHVAGAAALLKEARPTLAAGAFRDVLMNSADPKPWSGNPGLPVFDFVFRQGAGMVDIDDAIGSRTTITPSKISLGEGSGGSSTLTLRNATGSPVTYNLGYTESIAAGPPGPLPFAFSLYAGVPLAPPISQATFGSPSVVVPANGSATVNVQIAVDPFFTALGRTLYGGWVTFTPQGGGTPLRVPVSGFAGDYQAIVAMPTVNLGGGFQFPSIGREVEPFTFDLLPPTQGGTWDLTSQDEIPNVLLHFDHQVQRLRMQVVKASNGQPVHPVFSIFLDQEMLSRNGGPTGFFAFPWDGTRMHDNGKGTADHRKVVEDGQYKIVVTALKALGDAGNPAHVETYTSPTITIDRP